MAKAQNVSDQEWPVAEKIRTNVDLFNFLSRNFVSKQAIAAQKLHAVEFFVKP